jgi:hypothetical protein
VAKEWGVLPHVAEEGLRNDPEQLAQACIPILRYAEAYYAHKRANKDELKAWAGNHMMNLVKKYEFSRAEAEIAEESKA